MWEPLGNTTVLPPREWHPEPQFRGTFSILSSCIITMSLCIWTSLHLNIPEHRKEHLQKYRKAGWMVLGLLAPELVVWNAREQRKKVKELDALMRRRGFMPKKSTARERISRWFKRTWHNVRAPFSLGAEEAQELADLASTGIRDRNEDRHNLAEVIRLHNPHLNAWTDVHSWLVVMGGFAFEDKSPEDQQFMPGNRQRLPISWKVFKQMVLMRPDQVPDISRGYIEDKSKSDWLAKGLTCWQAGFFCIQCAFRLSQQLSITLLEINVFAHAICALLLFLCWWDKPRDVLVPITISSEEALQICAGHLSCERIVADARGSEYRTVLLPMLEQPSPDECFEIVHPTTIIVHEHSKYPIFMIFADGTYYKYLKVRDTYWQLQKAEGTMNVVGLDAEGCRSRNIALVFTSRDISRLVKAYEYFAQVRATIQRSPGPITLMTPLLNDRMSDWSLEYDHLADICGFEKLSNHVRMIAGIAFASSCYGGLHIIAWTSTLPSHAALVLWRAASVTILMTGPFCVVFAALCAGLRWLSLFKNSLISSLLFLSGLFVIWYILCRTFIVVECFILLAHIPESALRVPTWAAYIPSFG